MNRGSHSRGVDRARRLSGTGTPVFRIEGDRVSIVTDPYTPEVAGLDPVEWPVNVVIMSSATDTFHSKAANDGAKDLPRATGYRGKALHHGSSRGIEGPRYPSISFGDRRQGYVRWRRANWAPSLRA